MFLAKPGRLDGFFPAFDYRHHGAGSFVADINQRSRR
jgi:hypothetical protein